MFTFFRHLRQHLLNEHKITRYLAYAIGEIILVVIGILIAIQLNNLNEQSVYRADLAKALLEIRKDIREDSLYLLHSENSIREQAQAARILKEHLGTDQVYVDSIGQLFARVSFSFSLTVKRGTYESVRERLLVGMQNDSLRIAIDSYYAKMESLKEIDARFSIARYWRENVYPVHFKSFDWGTGGFAEPVDYPALRKSPEIFIALDYVLNDTRYYLLQILATRDLNERLLVMIEQELVED